MFWSCHPGFETVLAREIADAGVLVDKSGVGWVATESTGVTMDRMDDLCFPHLALLSPAQVTGRGVNAMATGIAEVFLESARSNRFDQTWPFIVVAAPEVDGLGRRSSTVASEALLRIRKRMARVARLARSDDWPAMGEHRGLFACLVDFDRAYVARDAWFGGQRRMADDSAAPSRSYLKVEEAYRILGEEPRRGETVVDLGAAPGGWSFSAAKRGASVVAVDNGPLKAGAAEHPQIEHRREDAFRFKPALGSGFDWLFCDLVEEPHHVLRAIVEPWLARGWCRRFVVNLKFGRTDAITLLRETRERIRPLAQRFAVRHLFHDREEFTLVGAARNP